MAGVHIEIPDRGQSMKLYIDGEPSPAGKQVWICAEAHQAYVARNEGGRARPLFGIVNAEVQTWRCA